MQRWTVYFTGTVQGVGFRFTAWQAAASFQVVGFVKNLRDGRVQIVIEGHENELQRFLDRIGDSTHGEIHDVEIKKSAGTAEFQAFEIDF